MIANADIPDRPAFSRDVIATYFGTDSTVTPPVHGKLTCLRSGAPARLHDNCARANARITKWINPKEAGWLMSDRALLRGMRACRLHLKNSWPRPAEEPYGSGKPQSLELSWR